MAVLGSILMYALAESTRKEKKARKNKTKESLRGNREMLRLTVLEGKKSFLEEKKKTKKRT